MLDKKILSPKEETAKANDMLKNVQEVLARDPSMEKVAVRLQKAVDYIEIILPDIAESGEAKEAASDSEIAFHPEVLPLDELLKPIREDNPSGENTRLTGEFNNMLGFVINRARAADFRPQYQDMVKIALPLLTKKSKDLGIAVRLIEGMVETYGFGAVAEGLVLINGLLTQFWETLYPEAEDNDCEARANELVKMQELIPLRLFSRYGEPHKYKPTYPNREAAEKEKTIFVVTLEQMDKLDKFTYDNFNDESPDLGELRKCLTSYQRQVTAVYQKYLDQDNAAQKTKFDQYDQVLQQELEEASHRQAEQEREQQMREHWESMPKIPVEPQNTADVATRLERCVSYLIVNIPHDPLLYYINRARIWFSQVMDSDQKARLSTPLAADKEKIAKLITGKKWKDVLRTSEQIFLNGGRFWLDLQRFSIEAARNLGSKYNGVANCITHCTVEFVKKNEAILNKQMADFTPYASQETQDWIGKEKSIREISETTQPFSCLENIFNQEVEKAALMAKKGNTKGAVAQLLLLESQAQSGRDKFLWRLHLAEFCMAHNLAKLALASIEKLVSTIETLQLDNWEGTRLLGRVFKTGHECYLKVFGQKAPHERIEYFYNQICLYNPGQFIK